MCAGEPGPVATPWRGSLSPAARRCLRTRLHRRLSEPLGRRLALGVVAATLALPARAGPPASPAFRVPVEHYRLANGLTVILHEDRRTPQVAVNLWFRVGSKDERPGRTGFAHLFEHLMFMGTRRVPLGQFDAIMEAAGGSNNASTSEDRTNYFESGPANLLETFLWLEADRLSSLPEAMTEEKVDLQRDVVKNERRQSYENRPYGKVELLLPEHMFHAAHPYHHAVIGSHEDLTAARVDDVKQFFRTFYVPANASLVIAGDFDAEEARRLVAKYFAWMPYVAPPAALATDGAASLPPAALAQPERLLLDDAVELSRLTLAWHSPAAMQPGDAAADLLAAVLGGGKSSRLHRSLVYERKIAQSVEVEQRGMRLGGIFVVTVTAQPGHTATELEQAVDAELARLLASPPGDEELERARAVVETHTLRAAERLQTMADLLNTFQYFFDDPGQLERRLLSRYDEVTAPELARTAQAVLGWPRLSILVEPRAKTAAPFAAGEASNPQPVGKAKLGPTKKIRSEPPLSVPVRSRQPLAVPTKEGAR